MTIFLLILAVIITAAGGLAPVFLSRRSARGERLSAALTVAASLIGITAIVGHYMRGAGIDHWTHVYTLPVGEIALQLDDLSAWFLLPVFLISALGSIYGLGYWPQRQHPADGQKLRLCWGLMNAAMMLVILSANSVEFLIVWEIMALAGYFLLTTEDRRPAVRQAGWTYFIASHIAILCLIAFFILLKIHTGSFALWPTGLDRVPTVLFILGLAGFGVKAGLFPLHVWLPDAHANAPSHVSALFSGVMLNMGVYGIIRMSALAGHPPIWWAVVLICVGILSALLGIIWASAQSDFKRILAYSSIENIGIIMTALGLAVLGLADQQPVWIALGLGGALLHMLNHSLFKPLLFMGAGGIMHATGTRNIESLGGLAGRMPKLFWLMAAGAAAISALPPLNGFISELLIYLGFFKTACGSGAVGWVALALPLLAMVGAMVLMTFIKLIATVFAGHSRTPAVEHAHDPGFAMLFPMILLAAGCAVAGIFPILLAGPLDRAIAAWTPVNMSIGIETVVPLRALSWMAILLVAGGGLLWAAMTRRLRGAHHKPGPTWGCGYAAPTSRMQYTGSSLIETTAKMLRGILWSGKQSPEIHGIFPRASDFNCATPDPLLERVVQPALRKADDTVQSARIFQSGSMQVYILYILLIVLILLLV